MTTTEQRRRTTMSPNFSRERRCVGCDTTADAWDRRYPTCGRLRRADRSGSPDRAGDPGAYDGNSIDGCTTYAARADPLIYPRASFWRRLGASLIDALWLWGLYFVLRAASNAVGLATVHQVFDSSTMSTRTMLTGWGQTISLIVPLVYFVASWALAGRTLGYATLGMRLVKDTGEPVGLGTALGRYLAAIVSALPFFLGYLWVLWDRERQAWHDKLAGTLVIED
jgi:uncharacterized RDD family membrane protein YckC